MTKLEDGFLMILRREEAKSFFGARTDEARLEFIQHRLLADDGEKVNCQGRWRQLHDVFASLADGEGNSALSQCLLGGRNMQRSTEYLVVMVRPDVVAAVAEGCLEITAPVFLAAWSRRHADADGDDAWSTVQRITQLYRRAAETASAMVFVAKSA